MKATELVMRATQTASPDGNMDELAASAVVRFIFSFFTLHLLIAFLFVSVSSAPDLTYSSNHRSHVWQTTPSASKKRLQPSKCVSKLVTANRASSVLSLRPCGCFARSCCSCAPRSHPARRPLHARLRHFLPRRCCFIPSFQTCQGAAMFLFKIVFCSTRPSFFSRLASMRVRKTLPHRSCSGSAAAACRLGAPSCFLAWASMRRPPVELLQRMPPLPA